MAAIRTPASQLQVDVDHLYSTPPPQPVPGELLPSTVFRMFLQDNQRPTPCRLAAIAKQSIDIYDRSAPSIMESWAWSQISEIGHLNERHQDYTNILTITTNTEKGTEIHLFNVMPPHQAPELSVKLNQYLAESRALTTSLTNSLPPPVPEPFSPPAAVVPQSPPQQNSLPVSTSPTQSPGADWSSLSLNARPSKARITSVKQVKIKVEYDQELDVFNKCLDEIEFFADQRLPQYFTALQEFISLNQRAEGLHNTLVDKKAKKKAKKDAKEEMDKVQQRMAQLKAFLDTVVPSRDVFVSIFQKIRLAFMLLTRLMKYLARSLPPETPLEMLINGLRDRFFDVGAHCNALHPQPFETLNSVNSPIFTREDVRFVTQMFMERDDNARQFWAGLNDNWKIPVEDWQGEIPFYKPTFANVPEPISLRFLDPNVIRQWIVNVKERDKELEAGKTRMDADTQARFLQQLKNEGKRHCKVASVVPIDRKSHLLVELGEILEIISQEGDNVRVRNVNDAVGTVPIAAIEEEEAETAPRPSDVSVNRQQPLITNEIPPSEAPSISESEMNPWVVFRTNLMNEGKWVGAAIGPVGNPGDELQLEPGEVVEILKEVNASELKVKNVEGQVGVVPKDAIAYDHSHQNVEPEPKFPRTSQNQPPPQMFLPDQAESVSHRSSAMSTRSSQVPRQSTSRLSNEAVPLVQPQRQDEYPYAEPERPDESSFVENPVVEPHVYEAPPMAPPTAIASESTRHSVRDSIRPPVVEPRVSQTSPSQPAERTSVYHQQTSALLAPSMAERPSRSLPPPQRQGVARDDSFRRTEEEVRSARFRAMLESQGKTYGVAIVTIKEGNLEKVNRGEVLEIVDEAADGTLQAVNYRGEQVTTSKEKVVIDSEGKRRMPKMTPQEFEDYLLRRGARPGRIREAYKSGEISVKVGDCVEIISKENSFLQVITVDNIRGYIPLHLVDEVRPPKPRSPSRDSSPETDRETKPTELPPEPEPPMLPPPPPTAPQPPPTAPQPPPTAPLPLPTSPPPPPPPPVQGKRAAVVIQHFEATSVKEITVTPGEILEILNVENGFARVISAGHSAADSKVGLVPVSVFREVVSGEVDDIVQHKSDDSRFEIQQEGFVRKVRLKNGVLCRAIQEFRSPQEQLFVRKGEFLEVHNKYKDVTKEAWVLVTNHDNSKGHVPGYVLEQFATTDVVDNAKEQPKEPKKGDKKNADEEKAKSKSKKEKSKYRGRKTSSSESSESSKSSESESSDSDYEKKKKGKKGAKKPSKDKFPARCNVPEQAKFLKLIKETAGIHCHVRETFEARFGNEITVFAGETVQLLDSEADRQVSLVRVADGKAGYVPKQYLTTPIVGDATTQFMQLPFNNNGYQSVPRSFARPPSSRPALQMPGTVRGVPAELRRPKAEADSDFLYTVAQRGRWASEVLEDYMALGPGEITVFAGDVIEVFKEENERAYIATRDGNMGYIPCSILAAPLNAQRRQQRETFEDAPRLNSSSAAAEALASGIAQEASRRTARRNQQQPAPRRSGTPPPRPTTPRPAVIAPPVADGVDEDLLQDADLPPENAEPDKDYDKAPMRLSRSVQNSFYKEIMHSKSRACEAITFREADGPKELTIYEKEILELLDDSRKWWHVRNADGKTGYIPNNFVRLLDTPVPKAIPMLPPQQSPRQRKQSPARPRQTSKAWSVAAAEERSLSPDAHSRRGHREVLPSDVRQELQESVRMKRPTKFTTVDQKHVLRQERVVISIDSTPEEITTWMRQNGFSQTAIQYFGGYNGLDLLGFTREKFITTLGPYEGRMMANLIEGLKLKAGYQDPREGAKAEMAAVVALKSSAAARRAQEEDNESESTN